MQLVLVGYVMGCSYLFAGYPVACWAKITEDYREPVPRYCAIHLMHRYLEY
jgi:hypothetical protein